MLAAFGSLIALGVTQDLDGVHGLESWRWLFIIEACMTVGFAACGVFLLPNYPHNTRWLKGEERAIAIWRLIDDVGEADDAQSNNVDVWQGFLMAVKDYKTWFLVWNHIFLTVGAGIVVFYPTVVGTLGFSRSKFFCSALVPRLFISAIDNFLVHRKTIADSTYRGDIRLDCPALSAGLLHQRLRLPSRGYQEGTHMAYDRLTLRDSRWADYPGKHAQHWSSILLALLGDLLGVHCI